MMCNKCDYICKKSSTMKIDMKTIHYAQKVKRNNEEINSFNEVFNHKGKMRMEQILNKRRVLCSVSPCWTNLNQTNMRRAKKLNKIRILCSVSPCWTNLKHESQAGMVSADELVLALVGFETCWLVFHLLDQSSLKYIFACARAVGNVHCVV